MLLHNTLHNRQTQTRAAGVKRFGIGGAIESAKDMWQFIRRDADARIAYHHRHLVAIISDTNFDIAPFLTSWSTTLNNT